MPLEKDRFTNVTWLDSLDEAEAVRLARRIETLRSGIDSLTPAVAGEEPLFASELLGLDEEHEN